jgi:Protein of unknown function (DUF2961)
MKTSPRNTHSARRPQFSAAVVSFAAAASLACGVFAGSAADAVNLSSLLREMRSPDAVARMPDPAYECLQASSYNRASTHRNQPDQTATGWFADSDGTGFIRTEQIGGRTEWVVMEHAGPGCITRIWTPYFYYDLNNHTGPNIRVYLDGSDTPLIDESLIRLVRGEGSLSKALAMPTARAGDSYVPIPFAKACKVTLTDRPFYYCINYRAYAPGTKVDSLSSEFPKTAAAPIRATARVLTNAPVAGAVSRPRRSGVPIAPGGQLTQRLPRGPQSVRQITLRMPDAAEHPETLRSTVLSLTFDHGETVWAPVGDFFSSADAIHPFQTFQRTVLADGTFICRWVMPYRKTAVLRVLNLGANPVVVTAAVDTDAWDWDDRSMHFHARWRPDELIPGSPFQDWNFVDINGEGVYVGDSWTVLNPQAGWWGEGDEKIYVDDAWAKGFPTHFGTGSEDYYGWAGGVNPTRADEFSTPFLANVRVGGLNADTQGYNICTRSRALDAIPFHRRLVFDMEASFGVDIRHPWDLLGYSVVTYWYARPGATDNRPAQPDAARHPIVSLDQARQRSDALKGAAR